MSEIDVNRDIKGVLTAAFFVFGLPLMLCGLFWLMHTPTPKGVPELVCDHDGVRVWRVLDKDGAAVYFTNKATDTQWEKQDGEDRRSKVKNVGGSK